MNIYVGNLSCEVTAVGLVALCMPEVPVEKRENDELD